MARTNTANFAQTPIVAPNISQTLLVGETTPSALFPASNFYAVIEQIVDNVPVEEEVVFCTSRTGTAFTVIRAQDGTTAKAFTGSVRLSLNVVSAHLQELRDGIDGVSVVPATAKTTPVDADVLTLWNSASSFVKQKVTWENIKATLKTYFDTLYVALTGAQTVAGIKTFSSFPITPSSAPTTDYQTANKKYVDDNGGDYIIVASPDTSTAHTNTDVDFYTNTINGIVAGDIIHIEGWGELTNTVSATMTITCDIGGTSFTLVSGSITTGNRGVYFDFMVCVKAVDRVMCTSHGGVGVSTGSNGQMAVGRGTSTNDITGNKTLTMKVRSNSATSRTLNLYGIKIQKVA